MLQGRILVVDDDPMVLMVFCQLLRGLGDGCEIVPSPDGRDALGQIGAGHFDLVIADLNMPGVCGVKLTEAIRERSPDTAVVWVTGCGCQHVYLDAIRLGVHGCYDKPLDTATLLQVASEALAGR